MGNHFFRNWKKHWAFHTERLFAEHLPSGFGVNFTRLDDGSIEGQPINIDSIPKDWDYRDLTKLVRLVGEQMARELNQ